MVRAELADRAVWRSSWLRISTGGCEVVLRRYNGVQRGTGLTGGMKSSGRRNSPSSNSGAKSGKVGPGLRVKGLGEFPGCSAVLLRGFAGVEAQRGGVAAARCSALGRGKAAAMFGQCWCAG